ncbi:Signal transduction histidine kinase [Sphingomonas gellani]|uniref:histidine kinase n=1 Tax=Sphingomonas gellani TaxID=1166340 RepID=A0A1H8GPH7_9SPHN|nr:HAMP domain-containing sensor histidine kinase [Sphingomonas gellani]SEN45903.1 Signal transduction histidine kinase [Sphingomonas gellani]
MAYSAAVRRRRAIGALVSGVVLAGAGAILLVAWQAGWWATAFGSALCILWIVGLDCWSALRGGAPAMPADSIPSDADAMPLLALLDQVPVPLVRIDGSGARVLNRAGRHLFGTDDRILPTPPELVDPAADRLRHEGRAWRISAVAMGGARRLAVLIDVDAEERAAEGRASDEMIDILGHELLNGLSPIVSLADSAVTAAARGDAMLPDILSTLARRIEGLEGFTRAYRTLSRLPDPVVAPVSLRDLGDDLARLFASRFGDAVTLIMTVSDRTATMDRDQLTQALWALLQNAAEAAVAAGPPCRVDLNMAADDQGLTIRIGDTGHGIAAPDRARIFRPFFTTKPNGSGIGLSLARRIARAHGGDLSLLPTARTMFELHLATSSAGVPHSSTKQRPD